MLLDLDLDFLLLVFEVLIFFINPDTDLSVFSAFSNAPVFFFFFFRTAFFFFLVFGADGYSSVILNTISFPLVLSISPFG